MKKLVFLIAMFVLISAVLILIRPDDCELDFDFVSSFDWIDEIDDSRPIFGTLWWALYDFPEPYISLDSFDKMYYRATGKLRNTEIEFDFQHYTYIIVEGHELLKICYNEWDVWGRFTAHYPIFHGKVWIKPSMNKKKINIYKIDKILINSDEHHRNLPRDKNINIVSP